jgi:hypothetical protein
MSKRRVQLALSIVAVIYFVTMFFDSSGVSFWGRMLPRSARYFAQVACLFPSAGQYAIEYRAEGWSCAESRWREIDVRDAFPIDADNKENRFQRAMHFYRNTPQVMAELDRYLSGRTPGVGGVRLLSLRLPLPSPGDRFIRYAYHPLDTYAQSLRKEWYETPDEERTARCLTRTSTR